MWPLPSEVTRVTVTQRRSIRNCTLKGNHPSAHVFIAEINWNLSCVYLFASLLKKASSKKNLIYINHRCILRPTTGYECIQRTLVSEWRNGRILVYCLPGFSTAGCTIYYEASEHKGQGSKVPKTLRSIPSNMTLQLAEDSSRNLSGRAPKTPHHRNKTLAVTVISFWAQQNELFTVATHLWKDQWT